MHHHWHQGRKLNEVESLKYLGGVVTDQGYKPEVLCRITQTRAAPARLKIIWNDKNSPLAQRSDSCSPWLSRYSCTPANPGHWQRTCIQNKLQPTEIRCFRTAWHLVLLLLRQRSLSRICRRTLMLRSLFSATLIVYDDVLRVHSQMSLIQHLRGQPRPLFPGARPCMTVIASLSSLGCLMTWPTDFIFRSCAIWIRGFCTPAESSTCSFHDSFLRLSLQELPSNRL